MQKKVLAHIETLKEKAQELYGEVPNITNINFNTRGKCAGQCIFDRTSKCFTLSFNNILLNENKDKFIANTVTHEFAHAVARSVYNTFGHDDNWRYVMHAFGIRNASRTHNYDTTNSTVRKVKRKFHYTCNCKDWFLTAIRHNRVVKGTASYSCPKCNATLQFKGEI